MSASSSKGSATETNICDDAQQMEPIPLVEQEGVLISERHKLYKPQPRNLVFPVPLDDDLLAKKDRNSGSKFNPLLHQPRRDMYGGDPKKGIPKGFQHILYDLSNVSIKSSNYDNPNPETGKVFDEKKEIYNFLAEYLEEKLVQRSIITGEKLVYDAKDDEVIIDDYQMSATVYMRTLDNSGL